MFNFFRMLWVILLCERGEEDQAAAGDGTDNGGDPNADPNVDPNADPADKGQGGQGAAPGGDAGQGAEAPAKPKYGEFGDSPTVDQVFEAFSGRNKDLETLKGKMGATERNLSSIRKALESIGVRAVQGEDGELRLEMAEKPKPTRKFTDDNRKKFSAFFEKPELANSFLEMLSLVVEDHFSDLFDAREKNTNERRQQIQQFVAIKNQANAKMMKMFPMLDAKFDASGKPANLQFNQAFYDRATEIWQESYKKDPRGEFLAALDAAEELGISAQAIVAAKKEGFNEGKTSKKVLGPVDSGKGKAKLQGALSKEEYLALTPEKREEYDKKKLDEKK